MWQWKVYANSTQPVEIPPSAKEGEEKKRSWKKAKIAPGDLTLGIRIYRVYS